MNEPTTNANPVAPVAPVAPAAPPTPRTVTMTEDELGSQRKAWQAEAAERAVRDRFKNQPDPAEFDRLSKELATYKAAQAKQAEAEATELQKANAARDTALAEAAKAKQDAEQRIAETQARYDEKTKTTEILKAVTNLQAQKIIASGIPAEDIAEIVGKHIAVIDGKATGKDAYERVCTVEDFLKTWVAQPNRANYRPPAPAGTGTDPGQPPGTSKEPPKNAAEAWARVPGLSGARHKRPTGTQHGEALTPPK